MCRSQLILTPPNGASGRKSSIRGRMSRRRPGCNSIRRSCVGRRNASGDGVSASRPPRCVIDRATCGRRTRRRRSRGHCRRTPPGTRSPGSATTGSRDAGHRQAVVVVLRVDVVRVEAAALGALQDRAARSTLSQYSKSPISSDDATLSVCAAHISRVFAGRCRTSGGTRAVIVHVRRGGIEFDRGEPVRRAGDHRCRTCRWSGRRHDHRVPVRPCRTCAPSGDRRCP